MRSIAYVLMGLSFLAATAPAARANSGWSAGAASVDITPSGPVWMAGYAARKTPSEGVALPIHAKALALRDVGGATVVLVTADLIGFDRTIVDDVLKVVGPRHKLPRSSVAFYASHTHTGPLVKYVESTLSAYNISRESAERNVTYRKELPGLLVGLIDRAIGNLSPADVSHGVGSTGFAINRREKQKDGTFKIGLNPSGPTDKDVPVLKVTGADGKVKAIVFGYACHNTTMTEKILDISGDYAGFAQAELEARHPGAVALFVTGCAADANPNPRGTTDLAKAHGKTLADAVGAVLDAKLMDLSGPIRAAYSDVPVKFGGPTDRASYEARLKEPGSGRQAHAKRMLGAFDRNEAIRVEYPYAVQAFALGDTLDMVSLAGEVVVDYSIRLKGERRGKDGPRLWLAAYANDVFGYIPSKRVLKEGGYEGGEAFYYSTFPTPFADDVEERIVEGVHKTLEKIRP